MIKNNLVLGFALALGLAALTAATIWPGAATFQGAISSSGTNTWSGPTTYTPHALTLVNGVNSNVDLSASVLHFIGGPTQAFSIASAVAESPGSLKILASPLNYAMTVTDNSATMYTTNRMWTQVQSNLVSTSNAVITLVYGPSNRWNVVSTAGIFAH